MLIRTYVILFLIGVLTTSLVGDQEHLVSDTFIQTDVHTYAFDIDSLNNIQIACEENREAFLNQIAYSVLDTFFNVISQTQEVSGGGTNTFPAIAVGPQATALFWSWDVMGDASGQAGTVITNYFSVPENPSHYSQAFQSSAPALLSLSDSTWIHAWSRRLFASPTPEHDGIAVGRVLDVEGSVGGFNLIQNQEEHMATGRTALATNASENPIVLTWNDGIQDDMDLFFSLITQDGTLPSEPFRVLQDTTTRYILDHDVTVLESGLFIITWVEYPNDSESEMYYQVFTAAGERIDGPVRLNAPGTLTYNPRISTNHEDITVIVWNEYDDGTAGIFARRIDPDGDMLGDVFRVTDERDVQYRLHPMVKLVGNRMVTLWLEDFYDLWGNVIDINSLPTSSIVKSPIVPTGFGINKVYPNPFNPSTTIQYDLPKTTDMTIAVYDLLGRKVWTYEVSSKPAGYYSLEWGGLSNTGSQVASGVYLISFSTPEFRAVQKAVLIR
jgi:hypothetical protein